MKLILVVFTSYGSRRDFAVDRDYTLIGRAHSAHLRVPLSAVSREHCEIVRHKHGYVLRDLKSSNGTHVNDARIRKKQLEPGDVIRIAGVAFTVVIDGCPAEPPCVPTCLLADSGEYAAIHTTTQPTLPLRPPMPLTETQQLSHLMH